MRARAWVEQEWLLPQAAELRRLEKLLVLKIAVAYDQAVADPEADRTELWELLKERKELQRRHCSVVRGLTDVSCG